MRLNDWLVSVQAGNDTVWFDRFVVQRNGNSNFDAVEEVAEYLIQNGRSTERKLVSKTLQELLYYCAGFNTDLDYSQLRARLARYLKRRHVATFLKKFLSQYFFNYVWFETGDSFRALSRNRESFEQHMMQVERFCHKVVASTWKAFAKGRPLILDSMVAAELVKSIERQLRGA